MSTREMEVPVTIVGGGPVGLTAGLLLAQQGVPSVLLEQGTTVHSAPKAHAVNPRSLEICRAMGIAWETVKERGTPGDEGQWVRMMTRLAGDELAKLPYERQDDAVRALTPTPMINIAQPEFEEILWGAVAEEPLCTVRRGHACERVEQDADGATVHVRNLADDTTHTIRSRHVIAADGAGSAIRKSLGIYMLGPARMQTCVMIHFEADLHPLVGDRPAILYWIVDPESPGVFIAHDIARTWVYMHSYEPDSTPLESFTEEACAEIVQRAMGADVPFVVRNINPWTMNAQVAESYRARRIFLVGDAAHRFPPTGGMGLNTGMQDAHNLAWKIAAVEHGWADASLLDSYDAERRPTAQENTSQSVANAGKIFELYDIVQEGDPVRDPALRERMGVAVEHQREHFNMLGLHLGYRYENGAIARDGAPAPEKQSSVSTYIPTTYPGAVLPHAWIERGGDRVSTRDLVPLDGFLLICGPEGAAWAETAESASAPVTCVVEGRDFTDPNGMWASVREIAAGGAVLVRPDAHVAWRAMTAAVNAADVLLATFAQVLGVAPAAAAK